MQEFLQIYSDFHDFINSTAAARVNGIVGGYGTFDGAAEELSNYGLPPEANGILMEDARKLDCQSEKNAARI